MLEKKRFKISEEDRRGIIAEHEGKNSNNFIMVLLALALFAVIACYFFYKVVPAHVVPQIMLGFAVMFAIFGIPILVWSIWHVNKWKHHGEDLLGIVTDKWSETRGDEYNKQYYYFIFGEERLLVNKELYIQCQQMKSPIQIRTWPKWGIRKLMTPSLVNFKYKKNGIYNLNQDELSKTEEYFKNGKYRQASLNSEFKNDYIKELTQYDLKNNRLDVYDTHVIEKNKKIVASNGSKTVSVTQYWLELSVGRFHIKKEDFEKIRFGTHVQVLVLPMAGVMAPFIKIGTKNIEGQPVPNGKINMYRQLDTE